MYNGLLHAHSGLRWVVLILLLAAIFNAFSKTNKGAFTEKDRKLGLFAMIFTHIQFLFGLVLYFISPKVVFSAESMSNSVLRFYLVEHITLMLIGVALITMGYSKSKKALSDRRKFSSQAMYYLSGLIAILGGIPWPFRIPGAGWF